MLRELLTDVRFRLRALFRRDDVERELAEELQSHLDVETDRLVREGMSDDDARRQARLSLGGVEQVKEAARDARGLAWLDSLAQDLRYALRGLRRHATFTAAAMLTLALGIGANGAVFSILQSALLQPLPYDDPSRLVMLWRATAGQLQSASTGRVNDRLELTSATVMSMHRTAAGQLGEVAAGMVTHVGGQLGAMHGDNLRSALDLTLGDRTIRLNAASVTPNFFRVLGVRASLGVAFDQADARTPESAIVLSDATWRRDFGADPGIVGRPITLTSGKPLERLVRTFTVAGVLPRGVHFTYPDEVEAWLVLPWTAVEQTDPHSVAFVAVARLQPGLSVDQAHLLAASMTWDTFAANESPIVRSRVGLTPMRDWIVGETRPSLYLLGGVAALLLLVTCVTVANGLLARSSERQQELAVRSALGAARSRILQQLLIEGTLLVIGGAIAGTVLAILVQPILRELLPSSMPRLGELTINGSILAFGGVITTVTTMLAAVTPAWGGTREDAAASLTRAASTATSTRTTVRWRHALVGAQSALTTMLLIFSALLLTSLWRLGRVPLGFDSHDVLAVDVQLLDPRYRELGATIRLQEELLRGVRAIPGVVAAGLTSAIPFRGFDSPAQLNQPGSDKKVNVHIRWVDGGFFSAFRVPIERGRLLESEDREGSAAVAVISESYARTLGAVNPIGQTIQLDRPTQVVGVVGDLRYAGLEKEPSPAVYLPRTQIERPLFTLVVRLDPLTGHTAAVDAIRRVLHDIDPGLPALHVAMVDQLVDATISGRRFYSVAAGSFAAVALLLTTIGLALVVARAVAERRRELAVRAVLGATLAMLARATVGEALIAIGAGVVGGLLLAGVASVFLTQFLFQVAPRSPAIYSAAAALVIGVAIGAAWLPMRRFANASLSEMLRPD